MYGKRNNMIVGDYPREMQPNTLQVNDYGRVQVGGRMYQLPIWVSNSTVYVEMDENDCITKVYTASGNELEFETVTWRMVNGN